MNTKPFYAEETGSRIEDPWVQVGYLKEKLRQVEGDAAVWKERAMALRLSPARGEAAVKALEWVDTGQTGFLETRYYAVAGSLRHTVHPVANEDGSFFEHYGVRYDRHDDTWKLTYWVGNNGLSGITGKYKKLEAAKAAAQADFERRIRSALVSAEPAGDLTTPEAQVAYWKGAFDRMAVRNIDLDRALQEIFDRHIPDQPASADGSDYVWAVRQYRELRSMAGRAINAALAEPVPATGGDAE